MFVQVITGRATDPEGVRRAHERWVADVKPGAEGFLGSTVGVADDGTMVAIVRFRDEAGARKNSERAEQGAWWNETAKLFDAEPTFRESSDVALLFDGGSNDAGFVQVMEGRANDRAKVESYETDEMLAQLRRARPDLLGSIRVWFAGNSFVDAAYFTSEAAARTAESSSEFASIEQAYGEALGPMSFVDLRNPLLA